MEIIQITDLHISRDINQEKHGCCPYQRLKHSLSEIKKNHGNDASLVITGDLSSDYSKESYENIKTLLKQYQFQISLLPGNHDDLEMMRKICDDQITLKSVECVHKPFAVFNFDTHVQDNVRGYLNIKEIKNLENYLSENKSKVIIFTHHPIIKVGSEWIDNNITENNNVLIQLMLKYHDTSFHIFSGHVHQSFYKRINNIEFHTTPSTCYQFKVKSQKFCVDKILSNGYRVIALRGNTLKTNVIRL